MEKDNEILYKLISTALDTLYKNDKYLIQCHANERAIVFRFGIYFQNLLNQHKMYYDYNLDIEYNRNINNIKRTSQHPNGIYPDIILHKRGSNNHNLLAIEFKGYWNLNGQNKDKEKIKELMKNPYNYKNGYVLLLNENDFILNSITF